MSCFKSNGDFTDEIWRDARRTMIARQRAEDYFYEASRPLYSQIAQIYALYAQYRMTVKDGIVVATEATLPDFAQRWIDQLKKSIELCRELSAKEANRL